MVDGRAFGVEPGGVRDIDLTPDGSAPKSCVEHFVRVLKGEEELLSTAEEAMIGLSIIEAIYKSSDSGRPVLFD